MATIHEHFLTDFKQFNPMSCNYECNLNGLTINVSVQIDQISNARTFAFYIRKNNHFFNICISLLSLVNNKDERLLKPGGNYVHVLLGGYVGDKKVGFPANKEIYSNKVYVYTENELSDFEIARLKEFCDEKHMIIIVRDINYAKKQKEIESPLAFISHDSRDKDLIARPLYLGLKSLDCTVWYDEYSLKVGDNLRKSIEKGIKEAKKCILIITPNFLSNSGWTEKEFDSIFSKEIIEKNNVILPIWYGVDKKKVYNYSPSLTNVVAIKWPENKQNEDREIKKIAIEILRAIKN